MADKDIVKETLRHYIGLEYYANGVDEEMQALLDELGEDCGEIILARDSYPTKDLYNVAYRAMKEKTDEFGEKFSERMSEEAEKVSGIERDFLKGLYGAALAAGAVSVSKLMMSNIGNKDSVSDIPSKIAGNVLKAYSTPLRSGYIFGTPSSEIKASADSSMRNVSREMQSGIRTAVPAFARQTDNIVFMKNRLEVVWCATLDGRTCIACGELHGKKFPSIAAAPSIPRHYNCRCVALLSSAVGKSLPTYKEFIDSLDDKEQREVLGKTRYEMYKSGAVSLERFVNNGSIVPVKELKETAADETASLVKKLYPDEKFAEKKVTDKASLFVSHQRIKEGLKDPLVYNSDKMMAKTLAQLSGKDFYLISENKNDQKNPSGFFISNTMEMKHVHGGLEKVGKNAIKALRQSENVFLYLDRDFSLEAVKIKIHGSLAARKATAIKNKENFKMPNGSSLLYIYTDGKLYELAWKDVF